MNLMQSSEISCFAMMIMASVESRVYGTLKVPHEWMRYSFTNAKRLYNCSLWSPWSYFVTMFQHQTFAVVCWILLFSWKREHCCQCWFLITAQPNLHAKIIFFHKRLHRTLLTMTYYSRLFFESQMNELTEQFFVWVGFWLRKLS